MVAGMDVVWVKPCRRRGDGMIGRPQAARWHPVAVAVPFVVGVAVGGAVGVGMHVFVGTGRAASPWLWGIGRPMVVVVAMDRAVGMDMGDLVGVEGVARRGFHRHRNRKPV